MIKRETNVANETRNQVSAYQQQQQPQQTITAQQQPRTQQHTSSIELDDTESSNDTNQLASFFWIVIDEKKFPSLSIPYLLKKNGTKYLSVRIIERVVLSRYENNYSDEVKQYGSLISELCSPSDVALLNEINTDHVNREYGAEPFTLQDTLVQLDDFLKFYDILSRTCRTKEELAKQHNLRLNSATTISNHLAEQRRFQQQQQQQIQQQQQQQQQMPLVSKQPAPSITNVQHHQQLRSHQLNIPDFVFNSNNTQSNSLNRPILNSNLASNNVSNSSLNVRSLNELQQQQTVNNNNRSNTLYQLNPKILPAYRQPFSNNLVNSNNNNVVMSSSVSNRQMSPSIQVQQQIPNVNNMNTNNSVLITQIQQQKPPTMQHQQQQQQQQPYILNQPGTDMRDSHHGLAASSFHLNSQTVLPRLLTPNSQPTTTTTTTAAAAAASSSASAEYSISPRIVSDPITNNIRSGLEQYHQNSNLANKQQQQQQQQINHSLYGQKTPVPTAIHSPTPIWPNQPHHQYQQQFRQPSPAPPHPHPLSHPDEIYYNNNSLDHLKAINDKHNKNASSIHAQLGTASNGFASFGQQSHNGHLYHHHHHHHLQSHGQMSANLHVKQLLQPKQIPSPLPPPPPPPPPPVSSQNASHYLINNHFERNHLDHTVPPPPLTAISSALNRPVLNNNNNNYNNQSTMYLNQNNQRINFNNNINNNANNNQMLYSSSTGSIHANTNHSILNSPTPPLTPTPGNLYAATAAASTSNLTNRLSQQQQQQQIPNQQQQQQQQQQIHSDLMSNIIPRTNVNSPISNHQHSPIKKQTSASQLNTFSDPPASNTTTTTTTTTNTNNNNEDDTDDIIILDEPIESTAKPAQARRTSSSQMSSRSSTDTNTAQFYNNSMENHASGFIQLNDLVVPYVRLLSRPYRCCSQYQPSNIYIPWHLLATTGLIRKDIEHSLITQFETILPLERQKNPTEFNRLHELLDSMSLQSGSDNDDQIVVVNLLDFFSHCSEPLFLKQHKPGKALVLNYKEILKMSGGIILLDIPDGPRDLLIFPFVNYNDLVLAPLNTFNNYIRHFDPTRVDYSAESLERETFEATAQEKQPIRCFLNLLLFYLTDNERRCKLPNTIHLINVKPWLAKHPSEFKILCEYTRKFPLDWIESIDRVLIKFKLFTRTLNMNSTSSSNNSETNADLIMKTKKELESCLDENKEEEEEEEEEEVTQENNNIESEVEQQQQQQKQLENVSLSPSSMDSATLSVSPFSNQTSQTKEDTVKSSKEPAPLLTKPIEIEKEQSTEMEITEQEKEITSNLVQEKSDETTEEANNDTQRRLSFDFDEFEIDETSSDYEIFKRKRRLSDSVLQYRVHADHYKRYLDDEAGLSETTRYDRVLSRKLDEINKEEEEEKNKELIEENDKNSIKDEPGSPARQVESEIRVENEPVIEIDEKEKKETDNPEEEEQEEEEAVSKNKRNASHTSISSLVTHAKRGKYSAETTTTTTRLHGDGIEDVSDSDESELLFVTQDDQINSDAKPLVDWRSSDLFTSEEDFDETYYLRKFNIQECCVLLRDVGTDAHVPKQNQARSQSSSVDSASSDHSRSVRQSSGSVRVEETPLVMRRDSKASSVSSASNDSTLLQPLNFNIKSTFASTSNTGSATSVKHKENKIGSK